MVNGFDKQCVDAGDAVPELVRALLLGYLLGIAYVFFGTHVVLVVVLDQHKRTQTYI